MTVRAVLVVVSVAACHADPPPAAPSNRSASPTEPPPYDGVTSCGWSAGVTDAGFASESGAMGSLDKSLIARPIKARSAAFAACYRATLERDPKAEGDVQTKFVILADGSVGQIEVRGFDRELDRCMCDELLRLSYPKFGSARFGRITVFYPFRFKPSTTH